MDKVEYHKKYYEEHYKPKLQNKKEFCECCQEFVVAWNIYKHAKTKKHMVKSLSEEERLKYLQEKQNHKIEKQIDKLKSKIHIL